MCCNSFNRSGRDFCNCWQCQCCGFDRRQFIRGDIDVRRGIEELSRGIRDVSFGLIEMENASGLWGRGNEFPRFRNRNDFWFNDCF